MSFCLTFQDVLSGLGCSQVVRLSLRMVTSRPFQFFIDRKSEIGLIGDESEISGADLDPFLKSVGLVGLDGQRWPEDQLLRSVMSVLLVGILRSAGYFGDKKETTSGIP